MPLIEPGCVAGAATLGLPGRLESVRSARDFTRDILRAWQLSEQFDPVALVVSELVTNALRHGVESAPHRPDTTVVELELMRSARRLICAVHDPCDTEPKVNASAGLSDEGGRGLHLVECFSDGWGWRPRSGGLHGKVVWASFRIG